MLKLKSLIISASCCSILLTACASTTETGTLLSEEPGYAAGFGDGCSSSQEESKSFSTKRVRDEYQFENDRGYRAGWRQGYFECQDPFREIENGGRILGDEARF